MSKVSTSITRGLKAIFYFFFPQSLFLEWPFICLFCILSAPFQVYFIFRAIFLPEVWFSNFKELTIVSILCVYLCPHYCCIQIANSTQYSSFHLLYIRSDSIRNPDSGIQPVRHEYFSRTFHNNITDRSSRNSRLL